jgi:hypothetical protein
VGIVLVLLVGGGVLAWWRTIWMPGSSHEGRLSAISESEERLAGELRADVERLAGGIGERNGDHEAALEAAAADVERELVEAGYEVRSVLYDVGEHQHRNLEALRTGSTRRSENVIVGAHYDSAEGAPGANDNGSGVAALLALARRFALRQPERTIRFVAFSDEEPPRFQTEQMGSLVYARALARERVDVVAMLSIETIGYYSDADDSQSYPFPLSVFYPSRGNFIAFVSDTDSRALLHRVIASFRRHARFPSEGGALPSSLPGVGWSDHWSFWQTGVPAVMITDTAPFRYPHYHTAQDTPDKIDYARTARVVSALARVIADLSSGPPH